MRAADRALGALGFGFRAAGPVSPDVVAVAEALAELAGQALERARLYEAEHAAAHQLQQALLPKLPPELPGAGIGVRYRAAEHGRDVGGDWYDGLIERREENIDRGLHRLAALAAGLTGSDAQRWADSLLAGMTAGQVISDDVVVACLHLRGDSAGAATSSRA